MSATQTETVGLALVGDFEGKAHADARAALAAADALDKLGASASSVKGTPKSAAAGLDDLTSKLKAAKDAAADLRVQADRAFAQGNKIRGDAFEKAAQKLHPIDVEDPKKEAKEFQEFLDKGSAALVTGGGVVLGAAAAIAAAGFAIIKSGVEFGVEATAARNKQVQILDRISGGEGEFALALTMKLGAEKGVAPETALERMKGLIAAKFSKEDTELLFKASADLGAVKGQEKAKGFLEQLQKTSAKGTVNEESLNALAEAGVNAAGVLEQLQLKGETLAQVKARVKGATISVTDFTQAVGKAIEKDFGGIAGKGLDDKLSHLKIVGTGLFSDLNLEPLESALTVVTDILESPTGNILKASIKEAGDAVLGLLDPLKTQEGRRELVAFFNHVGDAAHAVSVVFRDVRNELLDLQQNGLWSVLTGGSKWDTANHTGYNEQLKEEYVQAQVQHAAELKAREEARTAGALAREREAQKAKDDAFIAGGQIADGYAAGITAGAPRIKSATQDALAGGVKGGKEELKIKSPSRVFEEMGAYSILGYAKGANETSGKASDAVQDALGGAVFTARLPTVASRAAAQQGGQLSFGGGTGGAGGGAGDINITFGDIIVQAGSDVTPDAAKQHARSVAVELEPLVMAMVRRGQRDRSELGGTLATGTI